jgi:hypothetical protein
LSIHSGNWNVPGQLLVRSPEGGNREFNTIKAGAMGKDEKDFQWAVRVCPKEK